MGSLSTVILIPARGTSTGLPRKNLAMLCGKPLVAWTIAQACAAMLGPVIVVTDDPDIAKVADGYGATVYEEPAELATGQIALETIMGWMLHQCEQRSGSLPGWLVVLQPTSPLKLSGHIREAAAVAQSGAFDSIFSVVPSHHCIWEQDVEGLHPRWPRTEAMGRMHRQEAPKQFTENGAIYAVRVETFIRQPSESATRFCGRIWQYEMPEWTGFQVDSEQDFVIVELIVRTRMSLGADGVRT